MKKQITILIVGMLCSIVTYAGPSIGWTKLFLDYPPELEFITNFTIGNPTNTPNFAGHKTEVSGSTLTVHVYYDARFVSTTQGSSVNHKINLGSELTSSIGVVTVLYYVIDKHPNGVDDDTTYEQTGYINNPLSVGNVAVTSEKNLIYPTPSRDVINIADLGSTEGKITITDMRGRPIYESNIIPKQLSLRSLKFADGMYIIGITTSDNKRYWQKCLKQQ